MNIIQNYGIAQNIQAKGIKKQSPTFKASLNKEDTKVLADYAERKNMLPELYTMMEYLKELPGKSAKLVKCDSSRSDGIREAFDLMIDDKKVSHGYGRYNNYDFNHDPEAYHGVPGFLALSGYLLKSPVKNVDGISETYSKDTRRMPERIYEQNVWNNRNVTKEDIMNMAE